MFIIREGQRETVTFLRSHSKWQKHKQPGFQTQILFSFHCPQITAKGRGDVGRKVGMGLPGPE